FAHHFVFEVDITGQVNTFQFGHIFAYGENRSASRKHMVVALKELSIRGDFRTTVEYLIKLLETPAFEENTITSGWLDQLISNKLTAERPDTMLAVTSGAVNRAHLASEACIEEYRKGLEKGQVPSKEVLKTVFPVDKYKFTATRASVDSYHLFINGSKCFTSFDEAEEQLARALEVFPRARAKSKKGFETSLLADLGGKRKPAPRIENESELMGVCNVAIRDVGDLDDNQIFSQINRIIHDCKDELLARRIRRVTFICGHKDGAYPGYFTFRGPTYQEDESIRHSEPALAFQLELGRLSKFRIKPVFTENRNIHVYEAVGKGPENDKAADKRYFTRAVVRPGRLRDDIPTAEYLISEADR
ncbi:hypothetical protein Egran_03379, partial [Elaphomyces granulatus]